MYIGYAITCKTMREDYDKAKADYNDKSKYKVDENKDI